MAVLNAFIARTIAWYLVIAGAITATSILFAIDIRLFTPIFGGVVDYTPASVPALRHWGFMIFGIGVLMIAAAFRPWLRFETMLFCTLEKCFIVYLFLAQSRRALGQGISRRCGRRRHHRGLWHPVFHERPGPPRALDQGRRIDRP